jgi:hypothetical protein
MATLAGEVASCSGPGVLADLAAQGISAGRLRFARAVPC